MERYVGILNSYKPDLVKGFAGILYEICRFIERKGITIHRPKVVISTAEVLQDYMRRRIENVFDVKVYDFYGAREAQAIAGECNHGLLHIFTFNNHIELLDFKSRGDRGEVIITLLHSFSMPFIRYRIDNLVSLAK